MPLTIKHKWQTPMCIPTVWRLKGEKKTQDNFVLYFYLEMKP